MKYQRKSNGAMYTVKLASVINVDLPKSMKYLISEDDTLEYRRWDVIDAKTLEENYTRLV